ncbi:pentatricopeptide repeat-containing protein At1g62350-like [Nymphaea colorata]|nr:pentatricopeptide repeat-containing protein At1g62350-like [Nymphaea colorata]XP_031478938.1 pentatricopeptide repeat-containing protein At1g62350-like [Nymphaea colorata]
MAGLLQVGPSAPVASRRNEMKMPSALERISHTCHRAPLASPGKTGMVVWCSLRGGPRRPLWRGRVMSTETIQAVQSLKLAKHSPDKLASVFGSSIGRLIKSDLLATLAELQRQNEFELAIMVFDFLRKESWYRPDLSLYSDMLFMLGKNKLVEMAEELFAELKSEGLGPDTRAYTEMIGAFLQAGMVDKAMEAYRLMKEGGCEPDKLTLTILIRNLEKMGDKQLALDVKKECAEYMDFPQRFLKKVGRDYPKRRPFEFI